MKISTFDQAVAYLYSHIPQQNIRKFPGELGLMRMKALVNAVGSPQERYQVVHVAGTSGKGSTATLTSHLLFSQRLKVGLHLSPHILDIRERIQIDNDLITKERFVHYLNEIVPAIEEISASEFGSATYFEILVVLAYYTFWKEQVDVAVIETGMGGLHDGTNVVENSSKVAVITPIGFDHMPVLGDTLPEIAAQKAGIIQEGNTVIVSSQPQEVREVLEKRVHEKNALGVFFDREDVRVTQMSESGTEFFDHRRRRPRKVSLIGAYQADNAMLALEAVYCLAKQGLFEISEEKIDTALQEVHIPARFDITKKAEATLIIDGAHNEQKMRAFLNSLTQIYPNEKFTFLLAFKHGKDIKTMISMIEKHAREIVITEFSLSQDMLNLSESADTIAEYVEKVPVKVLSDVSESLTYAVSHASRVVVTGSLYFSSEVYSLLS